MCSRGRFKVTQFINIFVMFLEVNMLCGYTDNSKVNFYVLFVDDVCTYFCYIHENNKSRTNFKLYV